MYDKVDLNECETMDHSAWLYIDLNEDDGSGMGDIETQQSWVFIYHNAWSNIKLYQFIPDMW